MKRNTAGVLMVLAAATGFGTLAIFGKYAAEAGLNPTTLLTFRFLIGTALLWMVLAVSGRVQVLTGRELCIALGLGVLYAAFSGFFFWALDHLPAGIAGVVFYTYPAVVYLLSVTLLEETLQLRKLAALACAFGGVTLVTSGDTAGVSLFGIALMLLAAAGYAGYIVGNRAAVDTIDVDILASTALIGTTVSTVAFGIVSGRLFVPELTLGLGSGRLFVPAETAYAQWGPILGTAVLGTAAPLLLYVNGLDRIEASRAAVTSTAEPVVTVVLSIVLLDQAVTRSLLFGGVLILVGVLLIQTDPRNLLDRRETDSQPGIPEQS